MIVITGDSWGVGEYSEYQQLGGPGFANYLALNNTILNLSTGDASNRQSIEHLESFLERLNPNFDLSFDTFYWLVTDSIRGIDSTICQISDSLKDTTRSALYNALAQANSLAIKHNFDLKLIGGLCDLNSLDLTEFSNLEIVVPSWGQLLTEQYNISIYGDIPRWKQLGIDIKESRPDLVDEWIDIATEVENKFKSWDEMKDTFFTTCGHHPDRKGHLVLRDFLYPESKIFK